MFLAWTQSLVKQAAGYTGGPIAGKVATGTSGIAGVLYGFSKNSRYGTTDFGAMDFEYYRDLRNPAQPKTVRLAGVFDQGHNYLVIVWEPVSMTPTSDMPLFSLKAKVNGTIYDFTGAPQAGTTAPNDSRYLIVNPGFVPGQSFTIEFI